MMTQKEAWEWIAAGLEAYSIAEEETGPMNEIRPDRVEVYLSLKLPVQYILIDGEFICVALDRMVAARKLEAMDAAIMTQKLFETFRPRTSKRNYDIMAIWQCAEIPERVVACQLLAEGA